MEESKLIRDKRSGAVLNTNNEGLEAYRKQKEAVRSTGDRLTKLENDIELIKNLLLEKLK